MGHADALRMRKRERDERTAVLRRVFPRVVAHRAWRDHALMARAGRWSTTGRFALSLKNRYAYHASASTRAGEIASSLTKRNRATRQLPVRAMLNRAYIIGGVVLIAAGVWARRARVAATGANPATFDYSAGGGDFIAPIYLGTTPRGVTQLGSVSPTGGSGNTCDARTGQGCAMGFNFVSPYDAAFGSIAGFGGALGYDPWRDGCFALVAGQWERRPCLMSTS